VVTVRTASLTFNNSTFCPHSAFMCFVWISEQTAIISLYSIKWLVFITETECVYCAVRTGSLTVSQVNVSLSKASGHISLQRAACTPRCLLHTEEVTGCLAQWRKGTAHRQYGQNVMRREIRTGNARPCCHSTAHRPRLRLPETLQ
jgi:hypothetical protein